MTYLDHVHPCGACPFRKKSAPGWLGSNEPRAFVHHAQHTGLPCHDKVDYEDAGWEIEQEFAPTCAGSLILMKNSGMMPMTDDLREQRDQVEKSDKVFPFVGAFLAHHEGSSVRSWEMSDRG